MRKASLYNISLFSLGKADRTSLLYAHIKWMCACIMDFRHMCVYTYTRGPTVCVWFYLHSVRRACETRARVYSVLLVVAARDFTF